MWTLFRSSLFACLLALVVGGRLSSQGRVVEYDLVIAQTTLSPAGKPRPALTINGAIPGPVLEFTVGDTARITVTNTLADELTLIHWHGLLVPNAQVGVP